MSHGDQRRHGTFARRGAFAVVCACLAAAVLTAHQDSRTWQRAYEDGERALAAGQYAEAERSFRHSMEQPASPKNRSTRVVFSGTRRSPYYPEYYLAYAMLRQGKAREALDWFERIQRESLVAPGSSEASSLAGHIDNARKAIAPDSPKPAPAPPAPPPGESAFARQLKDAEAAMAAGRFDQAVSLFDALAASNPGEYASRNLGARRAQAAQQRAAQLVAEGDRFRASSQLSQALDQYRAADRLLPGSGQPGIREVERIEGERSRDARAEEVRRLLAQADSLIREGRYPAAMKLIRQALQIDPGNEALRNRILTSERFERARDRALAMRKQKRLDEARRAIDEARAADGARFIAEKLGDIVPPSETVPPVETPGVTPPAVTGAPAADHTAPLRAAVVAYLQGDARQAVSLLEAIPGQGVESPVRAHTTAWLAVAYADLSLAAADAGTREEMKRKAVERFKELQSVAPGYPLPERVVSPRIRQLLSDGVR